MDSKSYDQVCKYASIHIYANKCEAIYMSAVAALFILGHEPNSVYFGFLARKIEMDKNTK